MNILTRYKNILAYILCKQKKITHTKKKKPHFTHHTATVHTTHHHHFLSPNPIEIQWLAQDLPRVHTHPLIASLPSFQLAIW